jgi:hypothetical protein
MIIPCQKNQEVCSTIWFVHVVENDGTVVAVVVVVVGMKRVL